MLYQVFDCTTAIGVACHVRGAMRARLACHWLTFWTRRFHDYAPATAFSRLLDGVA